jgi:nicotinamidase-related amidase
VVNPNNKDETYETRLWPIHCVQNTPGAELVPELHQQKLDTVIEKGQRKEIEMYSAFYDPLKSPRCADSGLADILRRGGVDQVFVAGLAADYCVKATALDAQREGFKTFIVEEGTRAVDAGGWADVRKGIEAEGVEIISFDSQEVRSVGKV